MRFTDDNLVVAVEIFERLMRDEPRNIGDCSGTPFLLKILIHRSFEQIADSRDMVRMDSAANAFVDASIESGLLAGIVE